MELIRNGLDVAMRDERLDVALDLLARPARRGGPGIVPLLAGGGFFAVALFCAYVATYRPVAPAHIAPPAPQAADFELSGSALAAEPVTDAVLLGTDASQ